MTDERQTPDDPITPDDAKPTGTSGEMPETPESDHVVEDKGKGTRAPDGGPAEGE